MKKLAMFLMIGVLALPVAISTVAYAQDATTAPAKTKKTKKTKKSKKAKTDATAAPASK